MIKYNLVKIAFFIACTQLTYAHAAHNTWHFSITPYLWDMTMAGRLQVGSNPVHIDESKRGGMLDMAIQRGKLGFAINGVYSSISRTLDYGFFDATVSNKYGIFTPTIFYEIYKNESYCFLKTCGISIQPYVGARYTIKETTLNIPMLSFERKHHQHWTDPVIGLNINFQAAKEWLVLFSGDVGGKNRSTQYSYKAFGAVGYQPAFLAHHVALYLGYQILDQHYTDGHDSSYFNWNMKLSGPLLGINFNY